MTFGLWDTALKFLSPGPRSEVTDHLVEGLKGKHPEAVYIEDESLLYGPTDYTPPGVFYLIDEKMIFDAATKIKGSAGPSGDGCRAISNNPLLQEFQG